MNAYAIALFVHLLSLLVACAAASLTTFFGLRLRDASSQAEAGTWLALTRRVVPAFPVAVLGLLGTGIYLTRQRWSWSMPWIGAALIGLGLIVMLGSGVEAARSRALDRELTASGMSPRARRLLRDPVSWTAKLVTLTTFLAVVFLMTVKPAATECVVVLVVAVAAGALGAVPLWRGRVVEASGSLGPASS